MSKTDWNKTSLDIGFSANDICNRKGCKGIICKKGINLFCSKCNWKTNYES